MEESASGGIGFWRHSKMALKCAFAEFGVLRDMVIGTVIALITLGIQVRERLIPIADWQAHKKWWILSFVLPYIVVLGVHVIWRILLAPWQLYRKKAIEHAAALAEADGKWRKAVSALEGATREALGTARGLNAEWKELAARFEKLPNGSSASLQTNRKNNQTTYEHWQVGGDKDGICETLCKYAGTLLVKSPNSLEQASEHTRQQSDPIWRWLHFLKDNRCTSSSPYGGLPGVDTDGTIYYHESIQGLAQNSVRICLECVAHEL